MKPVPGGLEQLVGELVRTDAASTAVALVAGPRRILGWAAATRESELESTSTDGGAAPWEAWRFDLASLTKPLLATAVWAMARGGRLELAAPIGRWLPELPPHVGARSVASLLRHRAGFAAWTSLESRGWSVDDLLAGAHEAGLLGSRRPVYSDLSYLVLGRLTERLEDRELADVIEHWVAGPLEAGGLGGPPGPAPMVVPSHLGREREQQLAAAQGATLSDLSPPLLGQAQDGNARWLGGIPGHAGAFGTARDLMLVGREWLAPSRILDEGLRDRALIGAAPGALLSGWRRRSVGGAAGRALGRRAFGHLGFTGGSLFVDPDRELVATLLTHRTSVEVDLTRVRQRFHALAVALVE